MIHTEFENILHPLAGRSLRFVASVIPGVCKWQWQTALSHDLKGLSPRRGSPGGVAFCPHACPCASLLDCLDGEKGTPYKYFFPRSRMSKKGTNFSRKVNPQNDSGDSSCDGLAVRGILIHD